MAKKIVAVIKLALQAGKANPAPPVGPALGQHGVNIMAFYEILLFLPAQRPLLVTKLYIPPLPSSSPGYQF